ncbi:MAG TPA: methylenetetrahydrofolate reductase [Thermoplasmata archaeon]|nr:methylenetetrahydrofolate reductase [Thermoplasmata archaeon]
MMPADPTRGRFERALRSGRPVVTCEIGSPDGADPADVRKRAKLVRDYVDAVNVPDNTGGVVHAAPLAACAILVQEGIDPILHMTCRDRNRMALQSDLLGAALLGIRNILCLTGDHMIHGDQPETKPVYDIDSVILLEVANHLTREGKYVSGREIDPPPDLFPGCAAEPFAPPYAYRPLRLKKKVEAGARFVQTQIVFNVERFAEYMGRVHDLGVDKQVPILAGVAPIRSVKAATFMRDEVPGMEVPDALVRRMAQAGDDKKKREAEGIAICVEIFEDLRKIPGIAGFHIMPINWESAVAKISREAHLQPALGSAKTSPDEGKAAVPQEPQPQAPSAPPASVPLNS